MFVGLPVMCPLFCPRLTEYEFPTQILVRIPKTKFHENQSGRRRVSLRKVERTDRYNESNIRVLRYFYAYCAPKNVGWVTTVLSRFSDCKIWWILVSNYFYALEPVPFARYCNFKKLVTTGNLVYLYTNWLFLFVGKSNESERNKEGFWLSVASRRICKSVIMTIMSHGDMFWRRVVDSTPCTV